MEELKVYAVRRGVERRGERHIVQPGSLTVAWCTPYLVDTSLLRIVVPCQGASIRSHPASIRYPALPESDQSAYQHIKLRPLRLAITPNRYLGRRCTSLVNVQGF